MGRSRFAEVYNKLPRIPRWAVLAWLWLNAPASIVAFYGCPWENHGEFCQAFGNSVGALFGLFPMSLSLLLTAVIPWDLLVWLLLVAATGGCHLLIRRFLGARIGIPVFVGWAMAAYALTAATYLAGLMAWGYGDTLPGVVAQRAG